MMICFHIKFIFLAFHISGIRVCVVFLCLAQHVFLKRIYVDVYISGLFSFLKEFYWGVIVNCTECSLISFDVSVCTYTCETITQHSYFEIQQHCFRDQEFIPFYCWVVFFCMSIQQFVNPFPYWWAFGLFLVLAVTSKTSDWRRLQVLSTLIQHTDAIL